MTQAEKNIAHYTRLLAGSLSATERAWAEAELAFWRAEVALSCASSLARMRGIVAERSADWERTMEGLRCTT